MRDALTHYYKKMHKFGWYVVKFDTPCRTGDFCDTGLGIIKDVSFIDAGGKCVENKEMLGKLWFTLRLGSFILDCILSALLFLTCNRNLITWYRLST